MISEVSSIFTVFAGEISEIPAVLTVVPGRAPCPFGS